MSDLIDRQALLRQIDIDSDGEPGYYGDTWKFIDTIKRMPSALGTNLASLGTDCISRQAAIDALGEEPPVWYDGEDEIAERNQWKRDIEAIEQLPPIQPEIIRCKDCKFWTNRYWCKTDDGLYDLNPSPDDFCSRGERREVTE